MVRALALGLLGLATAVGASAALAPVGALNLIARLGGGYALERDIAYGPLPRQRLDVYRPRRAPAGAPVAIFFYGGSWDSGDKAMYRFVGAALANRGIVTVIPDYRVYPDVRFPTFLEDAARAVASARRSVSPGAPVFLIGHSAGAHIAAMLALDPQWLAGEGLTPQHDVAGLVGLSGPYDFLPLHSATLKAIFGPPETLGRTQPINFVGAGAPPAFLATGRGDTVVDPDNTRRLAERIRSAGGDVETRIYDRVSHQTMIGAFSFPLRPLAPVLADVAAFIRYHAPGDAERVRR